ncbi:hypothetical protein GDO78_009105 [Eleutherodactylus coqui]|uniref:Uncharacterized protein n=1 Tax=Eleutherodactylus coqui TaxID=57060 RepID=A0A8J6F8G6_ELECQ|nr:hypothetical protein GDO78_009105 [Eleutherodactylus coqui]
MWKRNKGVIIVIVVACLEYTEGLVAGPCAIKCNNLTLYQPHTYSTYIYTVYTTCKPGRATYSSPALYNAHLPARQNGCWDCVAQEGPGSCRPPTFVVNSKSWSSC